MHCAIRQNDGVCPRLRLTNRMCTSLSLSLASNVLRILVHDKEKAKPIPSLRCAISLQNV